MRQVTKRPTRGRWDWVVISRARFPGRLVLDAFVHLPLVLPPVAVGYVLFFVIHITQVLRAGWNNFRAMVTGYKLVPAEERPYEP